MTDFKNYNGENIELGLQATTTSDGLFSAAEKTKLNGIAVGATAYAHPATHPASIIVQDANNRFTTDAEKATWNAKASTAVATTTANGLMSSTDKTKLDSIATGANVYTHPTTHPASIIVQDANNRFVTDTEKDTWNAKASTAVVTTSANGLMIASDKVKLDGIAAGANAYTHPVYTARTGVPAANATPGFGGTFTVSQPVSDATGHITAINSRTITVPNTVATTAAAGLMSAADKIKLDGISYEYAFDSATDSYYKKYGDGTVDMYGTFDDPLMAPSTSSGGMYVSSIYTITYPVALLDGTYAHFSFTPQGNYPYIVYALTGTNYSTKTGISFRIAASASAAKDFTAVVHWRVIGRWK